MAIFDNIISPERRHFLSHGDGEHCIHADYRCEEILIPPWPVLDTKLDPPQMRDDIAVACLCECPPCSELRHARHLVDGVEGYGEGVVWR
jgi:hypothetical protein